MQKNLVLDDGTVFAGTSFGADSEVSGEVVFSTGMVGYSEALTDSSYQGQILVLTYPLIGNYGVPKYTQKRPFTSFESKGIKARGLVVANSIDQYSHWQGEQSLNSWLKAENIPAIYGIDTRSLTIKLREKGVMLGCLTTKNKAKLLYDPNEENLVSQVSIKKPRILGNGKKILLIDCGVKEGILANLLLRDVSVYQVPWDFDPFSKSSFGGFDGVIISNGPGNPKMVGKTITTVQKLMNKKIPILGICLGNQILALAGGGDSYKMKFGHRSHNQPVILKGTKKCYLTTQNHGFVVNHKKLSNEWEVWFENLNDNTNEGILHKKLPFMAVQFHPEGRPGPYDTAWIFDYFLERVKQT